MALPALSLDDFTWSELVTATQRRIPAASNGAWTLHAPVDPGITLIELYAWLLEQRAFWLDQVPDPMVRALLHLLGVTPNPVVPAATVLAFDRSQPWVAAAGNVIRATRRGLELELTPDVPSTILPIDRVGVIAGGRDRSADLLAGRAVRVMPADGTAAELQLWLWMPGGPPGPIADPLALFLELRTAPSLVGNWLPDAPSNVPPPAALTWWYRNTANQIVPWPDAVDDGTGGLRRSGVVRLPVPADWTFEPGSTIGPSSAFAIFIRTESATFTAPPRLSRFVANVTVARHRREVTHVAALDWLPLPGNAYVLPKADTPPIPGSVELELTEVSGLHAWTRVDDLAFVGPGDRNFVVDRDAGALRFGDGLTGRIPRLAAGLNAMVSYDAGGGPDGNVGVGLGWVDEVTGGTLHNIVAAEGGADAETLVAARKRAGDELREVTRAITAADYETLAITTPGVAIARAHAAIGYHALHPCIAVPGYVSLFIVPDAPREEPSDMYEDAFVATPEPDPGALTAARSRLATARLVTHEVCVRAPIYRCAALRVEVRADPFDADAMRRELAAGLQTFLDPLLGGDDGTGWSFGEPLRPSALLRRTQQLLGDDGEVTSVAIGLDGASPTEACHDVDIGPHALPGPVTIAIHITPRVVVRGGLR